MLPLLLLLMLGIVELVTICTHKLSLAQAVRAGSRAASVGSPVSAVQDIVQAAAPDGLITDGEKAALIHVYSDEGTFGQSWTEIVNDTSGSVRAGDLVKVTITAWPHRLVTGPLLAPVIGDPVSLSAQTVMRKE